MVPVAARGTAGAVVRARPDVVDLRDTINWDLAAVACATGALVAFAADATGGRACSSGSARPRSSTPRCCSCRCSCRGSRIASPIARSDSCGGRRARGSPSTSRSSCCPPAAGRPRPTGGDHGRPSSRSTGGAHPTSTASGTVACRHVAVRLHLDRQREPVRADPVPVHDVRRDLVEGAPRPVVPALGDRRAVADLFPADEQGVLAAVLVVAPAVVRADDADACAASSRSRAADVAVFVTRFWFFGTYTGAMALPQQWWFEVALGGACGRPDLVRDRMGARRASCRVSLDEPPAAPPPAPVLREHEPAASGSATGGARPCGRSSARGPCSPRSR